MKPDELLELLKHKRAYYEAVIDARGALQSPLVEYSATYVEHGKEYHHVGRHYVHFPYVECDTWALRQFTDTLSNQLTEFIDDGVVFVGVPEGGRAIAIAMGQRLLDQGVRVEVRCMEKVNTDINTTHRLAHNRFTMRRQHISSGSRVILFEDVVNTGANGEMAADLVLTARAEVIAVGCGVSRSEVRAISGRGRPLPLRSALQLPAPYYRQSDPLVSAAIKAGLVEQHPRENWPRLLKAQERARAHLGVI